MKGVIFTLGNVIGMPAVSRVKGSYSNLSGISTTCGLFTFFVTIIYDIYNTLLFAILELFCYLFDLYAMSLAIDDVYSMTEMGNFKEAKQKHRLWRI